MIDGGVIPGDKIKSLNIIEGLDNEQLRATTYNLRLGNHAIICGTGKKGDKNFKDIDDSGVTIDPFQSIIFETAEKINLLKKDDKNPYIVGRFDLKIKYGLEGFILQVGTQVEPGYYGPLFGLLLNTSGESKTFYTGTPFLQIEFSNITGSYSDKFYKTNIINSINDFVKYHDINIDLLSKGSIIKKVEGNLENCRKEHGVVDKKVDLLINKAAFLISVIAILYTIFHEYIISIWREK